MNKAFIFAAAMALTPFASVNAQDNDPVIMKINGHDIRRSEFEYSYNKNNSEGVIDKKNVQEYVQLYVDYKLKVEAAKDAGLDTLSNIKTELQGYREQIVYPTIENPAFVEEQAYKTYLRTKQHFGDEDLLNCQHILILMRQDATQAQQNEAKARIDSIYNCIKQGQDFAELAKKHSQDPGSARNGGTLPRFGKGQMIPDFEKAAYALKVGQISEPFKSAAGWHIVKMNERKPFEPYAHHHNDIVNFLNRQNGFKEAAAEALIDSLAKQRGVEKNVVFEQLFNDMIAKDSEARNLAQEYYDGTLMFEVSKTQVWDKAANDTEGLEQYFKKNKKNYKWTEPHFKGIVVHAKDQDTFDKAKALTKKMDPEQWATEIVKTLNTNEEKVVRVEKLGVFKKGDNKFIDKYAFKSDVEVKELKDYPFSQVIGKMMKKPKSYADVKGKIVADYQKEKEDEWVRGLRAKYPVEVYQNVVDTVNKH